MTKQRDIHHDGIRLTTKRKILLTLNSAPTLHNMKSIESLIRDNLDSYIRTNLPDLSHQSFIINEHIGLCYYDGADEISITSDKTLVAFFE